MKIVHICLCGPFTDGFNYQENKLAKYHKRLGNDVTVIASQWIWNTEGKYSELCKSDYLNEDGVKIIRLSLKSGTIDRRLKTFPDLCHRIHSEQPDILFIHGCQFLDILKIAKYLKLHSEVRTYVDNHVDWSNGAHGWISKNILHKGIWKYCVSKTAPYVTKFYGVLPARVDFLKEMYGLPENKCELLVMGADDELVEKVTKPDVRSIIRWQYGIKEDDFLIVTGGKINHHRPETLELMRAVVRIQNAQVKLLIFGTIAEELEAGFNRLLLEGKGRIAYVGWQQSAKTYEFLASSDLAVFPGLHSVMWEQAAALGVPCIYRKIKGFDHVDLGGNCRLLEQVNCESLYEEILSIAENKKVYVEMKKVAEEKGMERFSYRKIAEESIQV